MLNTLFTVRLVCLFNSDSRQSTSIHVEWEDSGNPSVFPGQFQRKQSQIYTDYKQAIIQMKPSVSCTISAGSAGIPRDSDVSYMVYLSIFLSFFSSLYVKFWAVVLSVSQAVFTLCCLLCLPVLFHPPTALCCEESYL